MNVTGVLIGLATFLCIGVFHPIVIKAEYYFGRRCWWVFALAGLLFLILSLKATNLYASIISGVISFSSFWGILEVFEQHNRVRKGWFPVNPRRKKDYED